MPKPKPESEKPPIGRPPIEVTPEVIATICHRVASGENLDKISGTNGLPCKDTIYRWLREIPAFSDEYARARVARADARSDRIDDIVRDMIEKKIDSQSARVAIDAEKWQAAHEAPKRYGDRIINEHSGPGGGPIQTLDEAALAKLTDAEVEQLIAIRLKLAANGGPAGREGAAAAEKAS